MNHYVIHEFDDALNARLRSTLDERVRDGGCPSVVATLVQGERTLFQHGLGERRLGAAAPDVTTVYRVASCTKSFTAVMLLRLRDRGLLHLDAPITDFVPSFTALTRGSKVDPPTLAMLASMSGGLPTDDPWADRQESISSEMLRAYVAAGVPITSVPGAYFQYSNLGYALLGQVIERVTGRTYVDLVTDEILRPLELRETGFTHEVAPREQLALGYRPGPAGWTELPYSSPGAFSSIGGLFSSARDLARWARWLSAALDDEPEETGPLSIHSRREMQRVVTAIPEGARVATLARNATRYHGYGLGLFVEHDARLGTFVSHSGGYPGFSAHMRWHAPTGLGVVAFENATYSGAARTATTMLEAVLESLDFAVAPARAWPVTRERALDATSLLHEWNEELARRVFEENVDLDVPFDERRATWARLLDEVGALRADASEPLQDEGSDDPFHLRWTVPATHGALRCEIRLSPKTPALIQTFRVSRA
ncbi:MAG: beta-lactamase family protein [Acidobacteriota bacterium]|nr:beta-lactamase family protein [Acidobacteriota bacterium]